MARYEVRRLGPKDWRTFRGLRLAMLTESPDAFWSSVQRERAYDETRWRTMLGGRGVTTAAFRNGEPVGLASGKPAPPREPGEEPPAGEAELVGMWVAPDARGSGVADLLVRDVTSWAADAGYRLLALWYTDGNARARRLYERAGFTATDETEPHPTRPDLRGRRMTMPLPAHHADARN